MNPASIEGATRALGAPSNWNPERDGICGTLPIKDDQLPSGQPVMISAWLPTDEERAAIAAGAPIYLQVVSSVHPPVSLRAGDAPVAEATG